MKPISKNTFDRNEIIFRRTRECCCRKPRYYWKLSIKNTSKWCTGIFLICISIIPKKYSSSDLEELLDKDKINEVPAKKK